LDVVRLSKLLAFVLRHRPDAIGVELDGEGWADVTLLLERLNGSGRLPAPLDRAGLERVLAADGAFRFVIEGSRVRARAGHTANGVHLTRLQPADPPDFVFFGTPRERLSQQLSARGLEAEPGRMLRLFESERSARRAALGGRRGKARVLVIEGQRAQRAGVVFFQGEAGVFLTRAVPRRFLLSERPGFERQVSAGVVLVRKKDGEDEIALIRTKPRADAEEEEAVPTGSSEEAIDPVLEAPPAVVAPAVTEATVAVPTTIAPTEAERLEEERLEEERRAAERRTGEDRRVVDRGPPEGVERRAGSRRRRRRRGGWGASGRMELPKGKLEEGETAYDAAVRELREETGLATPVDLVRELPRVRYAFRTPEGKSVYKVVHYFLLLSRDPEPVFVPQGKEGIVAVEWTSLRHALETIAFGNLRPVLEAARDALLPGAIAPPLEPEDP
jgi:putative RNA 2'-phosphotransferase